MNQAVNRPFENWSINAIDLLNVLSDEDEGFYLHVANACERALRKGTLTGGNPDASLRSLHFHSENYRGTDTPFEGIPEKILTYVCLV